MISRRKFIGQCSIVATATAAPASWAVSALSQPPEVSLNRIDFATFQRAVGSQFHFFPNSSPVTLTLAQVTSGPDSRAVNKRGFEEFSLIFSGPAQQSLDQNTYPVVHHPIGRFAMFIVPVGAVGPDSRSRYYEAVFNRPVNLTK